MNYQVLAALVAWIGGGLMSAHAASFPGGTADLIYTGGDIVTMNDKQASVEALAVKDGKILAVGERKAIEGQHKGAKTKVVDLRGKTLLPGFIDAHSHYYSSLSVANQVNVYAPPAGPGKDPASIVAELVKFRDKNKIPKGTVIQAYGYDENVMPNGRLLNRDDLDKAFPHNPVLVGHVSMHGAVMNSAALRKWNITAETKTPPGGVIVRKPGTSEPYGLALMQRAAKGGGYIIDVIAYPFITELEAVLKANPVSGWGKYDNRLKIGGVKITIDGSPQGRTAFFTKPYLTGGPGGEKDWKGELAAPQETVNKAVKAVYDLGVPLNLHANGDGAIDAFFTAHESAAAGDLSRDRHVTMIHAQFTRKDQIDKFVQYKVTPSFYTLHTFYFAEAHINNRGREQAMYISPMRDAIDKGLKPTNHTDFYVAPLDQTFMLWTAVNRISRGGAVIGADQRITALEGLRAMTINAARQHREDDSKGSLEPGKRADLVILDKNPLKVKPMAIKDIKVFETIKDGKTVYKRGA